MLLSSGMRASSRELNEFLEFFTHAYFNISRGVGMVWPANTHCVNIYVACIDHKMCPLALWVRSKPRDRGGSSLGRRLDGSGELGIRVNFDRKTFLRAFSTLHKCKAMGI